MSGRRLVSDADLVAAYADLGSVHKVGARFGIHGSSAHERLAKLGAVAPINVFTDAERTRLRDEYSMYRDAGRLSDLAASMGRTVAFLSRQAGVLGLTDKHGPKIWLAKWKYLPEPVLRGWFDQFKASSLGLGQWCARKSISAELFTNAVRPLWPDEWEHVIESKAPAQTHYRVGRAFEYRTRDDLRAKGFFVMRSPKSLSPIDLVAIARGIVLFVQCKRSGVLPPKEWNDLFELADSVGAVPIMTETITGRGVTYWLLTGLKDGSRRRQPMELADPHAVDLRWATPRRAS